MFYCITADYLRHSDNNIVSAPACVFHDTRCAAHKIMLKIALGPNLIFRLNLSARLSANRKRSLSAHTEVGFHTMLCPGLHPVSFLHREYMHLL